MPKERRNVEPDCLTKTVTPRKGKFASLASPAAPGTTSRSKLVDTGSKSTRGPTLLLEESRDVHLASEVTQDPGYFVLWCQSA